MSLVPGPGELPIHNDENTIVRTAFSVDSTRINHYDDVVDYMVQAEVRRCQSEDNYTPTQDQVEFLRKEIIRHAVIRRDVMTAQKIRIRENKLIEAL